MAKINAYVPDKLEERVRALRERGGKINVSEIATTAIDRAVDAEERRIAGRPVAAILRRFRFEDEADSIRADGASYGRRWAEETANRRDLEFVASRHKVLDFVLAGDRVDLLVADGDKAVSLPGSLGISPGSFPHAFAEEWFSGLFAAARSVLELVDRATELEKDLERLATEFNDVSHLASRTSDELDATDAAINSDFSQEMTALRDAIWEAEEIGVDVPPHVYEALNKAFA
jgi:hypothetical protein